MDRLIVKNFGPLKDVDIELNKINLFIGENGSGKSVLAKIITILSGVDNLTNDLYKRFEDYNIDFLTEYSYIEYLNDKTTLIKITKKDIFLNDIFKVQLNMEEISDEIKDLLTKEQLKEFFRLWKNIQKSNERRKSQYIPAERNLISLFNKYITTFITADIPLPKFLLNFSSQYVRAREEIKELNLLNVTYKFKSDQERIYYDDKDYLLLERSSSGIQSALPLYLTVKYFAKKHRNIIIEEPEQNLFPKAQTETIKYIIEQISKDNDLFIMTHSPYILTIFNILLYAHKVANLNEKAKEEVSKLIPESQWIDINTFSVYSIEEGIAKNIQGELGLISDNIIDEMGDEISCDFDELLDLYSEYRND